MGFRELLVARYIRVRGAEMGESSGARRGGTGGRVLSRSLALVCLGLVGLGVMAASTSGRADGLGLRGRAEQALATCSYTPLSLSLTGTGNVEDMRPFNAAVGDSYFQFAPAEPITVTGLSDGQALINQNLAGSVSGGMSGSFVMSSLNGGVINTISTSSEAKGFQVGRLVLTDTLGSISLVLAYNFTGIATTPPFYPRTISGYAHSTATTGAYSQYKLVGTVEGTIGAPSGRTVAIDATLHGKLYTVPPNATRVRTEVGSRDLPPIRSFSLFAGDVFAQFTRPDYIASGGSGTFTPNSVYTGTLRDEQNMIIGQASLDNAQMVAGNLLDSSPGWTAGNLRMSESGGSAYGVFLADTRFPTPNGYYFQTGGSGAYDGGLLFGPMLVSIGYQGGRDLIATILGGYYCSDFAPVGGTPTPTPSTPSATRTRTATATPTQVLTPAATATCGLAWRDNGRVGAATIEGMQALAANDVWAVGDGGAMHWEGNGWSPSGPSVSLLDISALSASDIWAVGYTTSGSTWPSLTMHWDGASWTVVPSPNPHAVYNALVGVKVIAHENVWAVGEQAGILHWDGVSWTQAYAPGSQIYLRDIDATSANDVWAVGNEGALPSYSVVLRWNGTSWTRLPSPSPSVNENVLQAVAAIGPDDVWAAGFQCCVQPGPYHRALIMHWDGAQWSLVPSPNPGNYDEDVKDLGAASAGEVWAVGSTTDQTTGGALMERWDGQAWSYVRFAPEPGWPGALNAVSVSSPSDAWAAGWSVLRYYDPCGAGSPTSTATSTVRSPSPTSTPTSTPTLLRPSVTATSASPTGTRQATFTPTADPTVIPPTNTRTATQMPTETPTGNYTPTSTPTSGATPCSMSFSDVQTSDYFYEAVRYLYCGGVISGYRDNTFRPYNLTTRGQLAKIVVLAEGWGLYAPPGPTFRDVPASHTFYAYVETAYQRGIISGYSCGAACLEFRPGNNVTRGQLCKIVVLAEGWGIYTPPTPTFRDMGAWDAFFGYVETAYSQGIISGYGCGVGCLEFRPGSNATRGQIAKIVYLAVGP